MLGQASTMVGLGAVALAADADTPGLTHKGWAPVLPWDPGVAMLCGKASRHAVLQPCSRRAAAAARVPCAGWGWARDGERRHTDIYSIYSGPAGRDRSRRWRDDAAGRRNPGSTRLRFRARVGCKASRARRPPLPPTASAAGRASTGWGAPSPRGRAPLASASPALSPPPPLRPPPARRGAPAAHAGPPAAADRGGRPAGGSYERRAHPGRAAGRGPPAARPARCCC